MHTLQLDIKSSPSSLIIGCTHYGVGMDIVAYMDVTRSSTFSILLQYPIPNAMLYYRIILNIIRMGPLPFLMVQYLTWPHSFLGLGFLHASNCD